MKYLKKSFESCDIFGQPVQFSLNRKYLQKSIFGGIMTFLLIMTFILIAFQGFSDLINRQNITSYTQDVYNFRPPAIDFNSRSFSMAMSFNDQRLNNPRYFKLQIFQGLQSAGNIQIIEQNTEPCTLDHFPLNLQNSILNVSNNLSGMICAHKDINIKVEGAYSSPVFNYFWIKLSKCQNTDEITCYSDDAIDEIFNELGRVYLNVFFSNNIITANDFSNPVSSFLDDRIYVLVDRNSYKEKNFFFLQSKLYTDSSILTTNYVEELNTYTYENIYDETIVQIADHNATDIMYAGIFFRSNILGKAHIRTFEKIGKFIGYIGGFWSMLFLLFSIVAKSFNRYKLLVKLANSLYRFTNDENMANETTVKKSEEIYSIKQNPSNNNTIEDKIKEFIRKAKGFKLLSDFKSFLFQNRISRFFHICDNSKQQLIREKASITIEKDIDIVHLLTKMKEIDKLKSVLFTKSQKKLFEYFSKTKISPSYHSNPFNFSRSSLLFLRKSIKKSSSKKSRIDSVQPLAKANKNFISKKLKNSNENQKIRFEIHEKKLKAKIVQIPDINQISSSQIVRMPTDENCQDNNIKDFITLYQSFIRVKEVNGDEEQSINERILNCFDKELFGMFLDQFIEEKQRGEKYNNNQSENNEKNEEKSAITIMNQLSIV